MPPQPDVAVVFATHNRSDRLAALLVSLRQQTLGTDRFEVVVVDDASTDGTPQVLAAEQAEGVLDLTVIRHERGRGPAVARNAGWRAARAPFVVFTDDDCVASPGWVQAALEAWGGDPERFVQGRTDPNPAELDRDGPFSRTLRIHHLGPNYQTCNVAYPRALLERVGGFYEGFDGPSAEDADLAWRCLDGGATSVFAAEAQVFHAVHELGPVGLLRLAWRWHEIVRLIDRQRAHRRELLTYRIFWKKTHFLLARAALGFLLPRRWRALRFWCFAPIAPAYLERGRAEAGTGWLGPYYLVHDLVEVAAILRGTARHRTLVI